jgi:hypothetical protein
VILNGHSVWYPSILWEETTTNGVVTKHKNLMILIFFMCYSMGVWFNTHQYCGKKNDTWHFIKKTKCV